MKKILSVAVILIWATIIAGCTSGEQQAEAIVDAEVEKAVITSASEAEKLVLNNGEKWKADSITNANVVTIESIISNSNPVTLEDHLKTADETKESLNKLIKDCRMKGPEHDALHHWLEPFLATHKQFSEAKTVAEAQELFKELGAQIKVYPEFFE